MFYIHTCVYIERKEKAVKAADKKRSVWLNTRYLENECCSRTMTFYINLKLFDNFLLRKEEIRILEL